MNSLEMSKPPLQSKHEASLDPELGSKPPKGLKKSQRSSNLYCTGAGGAIISARSGSYGFM